MTSKCAVLNCSSNHSRPASTSRVPLFRFPRDPERCKRWVERCNRADLQGKTSDQLYRYHRLCAKHFDPSVIETTKFHNTAAFKAEAVPTIFDNKINIKLEVVDVNPKGGQRKRKKDPSKDDPRDIKKKKENPTDETDNAKDVSQVTTEQDHREFIKSQFEVLVVLSKQNIPPSVHIEEGNLTTSNVQTLLEYRMNAGDESLRKRCETTPPDNLFSSLEQSQMIEVAENCLREELLHEIREGRFFSIVTDDLVEIGEQCHIPIFLRFVDQSNRLREEFAGLLPFDGDEETLTAQLLSEVIFKWGLNMEYCRGQAHLCSGVNASKMKAIATRITEKYPLALRSTVSTFSLNTLLAKTIPLSGVQIVLSTFRKIETFFKDSPSLQLEFDNAISIFYQGKEEKANELKEACRSKWTLRHDAFEMAIDILESLLLCVDSVHDNEDLRWTDEVTHRALEISKALADFEFVVALVVLKNTLSFTRAFGKNLQGRATYTYATVNNLTAVMHSLTEVSDNMDVYHEFWFEEAINLAAAMEIPVKVPRMFLRKNRFDIETEVQPEKYYKDHLSVPVVAHVLKEMNDLFTESHVKAMRCLMVVPALIGHLKFDKTMEEHMEMYKGDFPNADALSAELHCWWVKWKQGPKKDVDDTLPSSIRETLDRGNVHFFPNVLTLFKVLATLPVLTAESSCDSSRKRFKVYVDNTPDRYRSKSLIFLNMHYDATYDLDSMVDAHIKKYSEKD